MTIDIVKCHPVNCSRKETCLRYTHPPRSRWQAYLTEGVVKLGDADNGEVCLWWVGDYEGFVVKGVGYE